MTLRLGTRASQLAQWQADWVARRLTQRGVRVELVPITTTGDRNSVGPISQLGGQGVFTKEIQQALLDNRIDLAVHSLKDLATEPVPGLCLAAVPERGPVGDVLVCPAAGPSVRVSLEALPHAARVGTGSLRRRAQLLHARPDLVVEDIRGNVETRLAKLDAGAFDALVLAQAGLERLGLADRITHVLPLDVMLPAIGQGALGLETRSDDNATREAVAREAVAALDDPDARAAVLAERAMLHALHGGCSAPIGAWARVVDCVLFLDGRVLSPDGVNRRDASASAPPHTPESLGRRVAEALI